MNTMPEYVLVYDIAKEGYTQWRFALFGLLFMGTGIALSKIPFTNILFGLGKDKAKNMGRYFFAFSIIWMFGAVSLTYYSHKKLIKAYKDGQYEVIEGTVKTYEAPRGSSTEHGYKLGDKKLWDCNLPIGPEFVQPALKKIHLKEGLKLRIAFSGSSFLKVEIEKE